MKNGRYESIKEWLVCIKNDFNESIKGSTPKSRPIELMVMQLANFILLALFIYSFTYILAPYIKSLFSFIDILKYRYTSIFVACFLLESIKKCLNHLGFTPINRFGISQIFEFDLKPSYQIYTFLILINLMLVIPYKYLKNYEYARRK